MEQNPNPNPHDRLRQNAGCYWSELPLELTKLVFDHLGFADFEQAKSVSSSWHSASRQAVPKNQIPWLVLFPDRYINNRNSCTLFNPEVKDKLYKTKDLGSEFTESVCIATYGNWLLMQDRLYNLYILNLFTNERINLPHVSSQLGTVKIEFERFAFSHDEWFLISNGIYNQRERGCFNLVSPLFWIDERTKDYVVVWGLGEWCVVYAKKGDELWKQIPQTSNCSAMAYKDHKLYFSGCQFSFRIFDFSGEVPQQCMYRFCLDPSEHNLSDLSRVVDTKLVVTVKGDVLRVLKLVLESSIWSFLVYKVYSSGSFKKHERVDSLGDEAMFLDLGITVLANDVQGLKKNSIYFNGSYFKNPTEICVFNLDTQKMEPLHEVDCSPRQLSRARWFLPSIMRKTSFVRRTSSVRRTSFSRHWASWSNVA